MDGRPEDYRRSFDLDAERKIMWRRWWCRGDEDEDEDDDDGVNDEDSIDDYDGDDEYGDDENDDIANYEGGVDDENDDGVDSEGGVMEQCHTHMIISLESMINLHFRYVIASL